MIHREYTQLAVFGAFFLGVSLMAVIPLYLNDMAEGFLWLFAVVSLIAGVILYGIDAYCFYSGKRKGEQDANETSAADFRRKYEAPKAVPRPDVGHNRAWLWRSIVFAIASVFVALIIGSSIVIAALVSVFDIMVLFDADAFELLLNYLKMKAGIH